MVSIKLYCVSVKLYWVYNTFRNLFKLMTIMYIKHTRDTVVCDDVIDASVRMAGL